MGIKTVPHPPYSPDLAHSDFWLFPKLRGSCYETIEEMKEAVRKVIDTLTQSYCPVVITFNHTYPYPACHNEGVVRHDRGEPG